MKINEIKLFLKNLTEVSSNEGQYISKNGTGFSIADKNSKNLNTSDIAQIARDCFASAKIDPSLSLKERSALMKGIGQGIEVYSYRLYYSKTWYQKIASYICIPTEEENELSEIKAKVFTYKDKLNDLKFLLDDLPIELDRTLNEPHKQLLQASVKLLEGALHPSLGALTSCHAIKSYKNDLEAYKQSIGAFNQPLSNKLDKIMAELDSSSSISLLQQGAVAGASKKFLDRELYIRMTAKIQYLKEKGEIGDQIIFPGGYGIKQGKGHAILFQLVKTDDESCSITIVDSGLNREAISEFMYSRPELFSEFLDEDMVDEDKFFAILKSHRLSVHDRKFENVRFDLLNENFMKELHKIYEPIEDISSTAFIDEIQKCILNKENGVVPSQGRVHKAQARNSCTLKSISCWIKETLGEDYPAFKLFVTRREIERLNKLSLDPAHSAAANEILDKSKAVLLKREAKIA